MRDGTIVFAAQYQDPPEQKRLPHSTIIFDVIGTGTTVLTYGLRTGDAITSSTTYNPLTGALTFGSVTINVIPEPGTALLMGLGLMGLGVAGRRNR